MDKPFDYLYVCDMMLFPHDAEPLVASQTRCQVDWRWDSDDMPPRECIFWLVVRGRGVLMIDGRERQLRAGDCFVLRPWRRCVGEHDPRRPLTVNWAHFRYRDSRGRVRPTERSMDGDLPVEHRQVEHLGFLCSLFDRVVDACDEAHPRDDNARAWFAALMLEVQRQDELPRLGGLDREHYEQIRDLCARIRTEPGRPWRVRRLAAELCYSPEHFSRLFRRWAGAAPREFIMAARIDAARSLLRLSSHSITRIAELVGFGDVYHFSRRFREKTGASPSAYRKSPGPAAMESETPPAE